MMKTIKNKKGFVLLELITVLIILTLLAAIITPAMVGWIHKSNEKKSHLEMNWIAKAATATYAESYSENKHAAPSIIYSKVTDWSKDAGAYPENFKALLNDEGIFDKILSFSIFSTEQAGFKLAFHYETDGVIYYYNNSENPVISMR